jgi:hypothetical protein
LLGDDELRARMGIAGRLYAADNLWDENARRVLDLYGAHDGAGGAR